MSAVAMSLMWIAEESPTTHQIVGWSATVGCLIITAKCAHAFTKKTPRIFHALALVATSWAALVPYYGGQEQAEALAGINGILLVLAGSQLRRQAAFTHNKVVDDPPLVFVDRACLWLLVPAILPSAAKIFPIAAQFNVRIDVIIASVMTLFGFASIADGVRRLRATRLPGIFLTVVLVAYAGAEVQYVLQVHQPQVAAAKDRDNPDRGVGSEAHLAASEQPDADHPTPEKPKGEAGQADGSLSAAAAMSPLLYYWFAALKMLFTVAILSSVLPFAMRDRHRSAGSFLKRFLNF